MGNVDVAEPCSPYLSNEANNHSLTVCPRHWVTAVKSLLDGRCWWWAGGYKTKWKVNLIAPQLVHFVLPADSLSRRHHPNIGKIFSPRAVLVYFIPMPHLKIGSVSPHRGTPLAPLLSWQTPPLASLIPKYPHYSPRIQVRGFKSSLWEVAGEHRYWDKARNAKYGLNPR